MYDKIIVNNVCVKKRKYFFFKDPVQSCMMKPLEKSKLKSVTVMKCKKSKKLETSELYVL